MDIKSPELIRISSTPHKILTALILNIAYGIFIIDFPSVNPWINYFCFVLNFLAIYFLENLIEKVLSKLCKPGFYNRNRMTVLEAIERSVTPGGKFKPNYSDRDYKTRFNFELRVYSVILTYFIYALLIMIISWLINLSLMTSQIGNFVNINNDKLAVFIILLFGYIETLSVLEDLDRLLMEKKGSLLKFVISLTPKIIIALLMFVFGLFILFEKT
ncbi:MAG TPA: hypothetical protein VMW41_05845 [Candidatus Bathyarchaeia archaeon]|nr:hypothetical protein [Candidatus Bathyarchaeia archaeon]